MISVSISNENQNQIIQRFDENNIDESTDIDIKFWI